MLNSFDLLVVRVFCWRLSVLCYKRPIECRTTTLLLEHSQPGRVFTFVWGDVKLLQLA